MIRMIAKVPDRKLYHPAAVRAAGAKGVIMVTYNQAPVMPHGRDGQTQTKQQQNQTGQSDQKQSNQVNRPLNQIPAAAVQLRKSDTAAYKQQQSPKSNKKSMCSLHQTLLEKQPIIFIMFDFLLAFQEKLKNGSAETFSGIVEHNKRRNTNNKKTEKEIIQ